MKDPIITMATPAIDWSNAWDYESLAEITDGLFIMGYNYFYSGSSNAGPVAPLGGYFYDNFGSFDYAWYLAIVLSFIATAVHLPIDERPLKIVNKTI